MIHPLALLSKPKTGAGLNKFFEYSSSVFDVASQVDVCILITGSETKLCYELY